MDTMNPCVAHRGWSGLAPENTLAAIRMAAFDPTIHMIEVDVQLSKDGIPMVIHDTTLERTTNGTGKVKEHTTQQLQQLDAGSWFHAQFAQERIPTLEDVLHLCKGLKPLNLELKQFSSPDSLLEEKVIERIHLLDMNDEVVITSFDHHSIQKVKAFDPEIPVGLIYMGNPICLKEQMHAAGATTLSIHYPYLSSELVKLANQENFQIITWTVDTLEEMQKINQLGGHIGICTNHPEVWKKLG